MLVYLFIYLDVLGCVSDNNRCIGHGVTVPVFQEVICDYETEYGLPWLVINLFFDI
jgi:hypothetical protein